MRATDPEQRTRGPALAVVEQPACPPCSQSETSGPSVSGRWSVGRGLEQSASGIEIRSESLENPEKRRREVLAGRAPEKDDVRRGERVKRRRLRRKVRAVLCTAFRRRLWFVNQVSRVIHVHLVVQCSNDVFFSLGNSLICVCIDVRALT